MTTTPKTRNVTRAPQNLLWFCAGIVLAACGRTLNLESRDTLSPDDLQQNYQISIAATNSGLTSYSAYAIFNAVAGSSFMPTALPAGDSVTLNGNAMTEQSGSGSVEYQANGSGNLGKFAFEWTHGTQTYQNSFTATLYPPTTAPTTISKKSSPQLQVLAVPAGVSINATIYDGNNGASSPQYAILPVEVSGGGLDQEYGPGGTVGLADLIDGSGEVFLQENWQPSLQQPTAAGGTGIVSVQFSYDVTITE